MRIFFLLVNDVVFPSMKVPPKRKGNITALALAQRDIEPLNESPSEKEGK